MKRIGSFGLVLIPMVFSVSMVVAESQAPGQVVDRFYDAYRRGSVEEMLNLYADNAIFEDINQRHRLEGAEQLQGFLARIVGLHQEIGIQEKRRVTYGNMVVVEYEYIGTLSGAALRQLSGKDSCQDVEYALPVTTWYEIRDGRIFRQKDFIDLATYREIQQKALGLSAEQGDES